MTGTVIVPITYVIDLLVCSRSCELQRSRVNLTRANVPTVLLVHPLPLIPHFIPNCRLFPLSISSVSSGPAVIINTWLLWRKLSILVLLFSPSKYGLLWLLGRLRRLPLHVPSFVSSSFGFLL